MIATSPAKAASWRSSRAIRRWPSAHHAALAAEPHARPRRAAVERHHHRHARAAARRREPRRAPRAPLANHGATPTTAACCRRRRRRGDARCSGRPRRGGRPTRCAPRAARRRGGERAAEARRAAAIALLDYETALKLSEDTNCGHRNLDVLMERVESMLTMCAQRSREDEPGWNYEGYGCDDGAVQHLRRGDVHQALLLAEPVRDVLQVPSRGAVCNPAAEDGPAYVRRRPAQGVRPARRARPRRLRVRLRPHVDMVCSRWHQLHDEESRRAATTRTS